MNRIAALVSDQAFTSSKPSTLRPLRNPAKSATKQPLSHCFFRPMNYEPNYAYPLVVWIHGPDDDERQIHRVMPHISLRNYVGVSPRGTEIAESSCNETNRYTWAQSGDGILAAMDRVMDCIELAKSNYRIADSRVFLAGYDAGGTMALRLAMTNPQSFAGVASFNGPLPRQQMLLRNIEMARSFPTMIAYGRDSVEYDTDTLVDDLRLIHVAGMKNLNIRQYPCSDDLVTQMLKDFDAWVMELVTGSRMHTGYHHTSGLEGLN